MKLAILLFPVVIMFEDKGRYDSIVAKDHGEFYQLWYGFVLWSLWCLVVWFLIGSIDRGRSLAAAIVTKWAAPSPSHSATHSIVAAAS